MSPLFMLKMILAFIGTAGYVTMPNGEDKKTAEMQPVPVGLVRRA